MLLSPATIQAVTELIEANGLCSVQDIGVPPELVLPFLLNCPIRRLATRSVQDPNLATSMVYVIKARLPGFTYLILFGHHTPIPWLGNLLTPPSLEEFIISAEDDTGASIIDEVITSSKSSFISCPLATMVTIFQLCQLLVDTPKLSTKLQNFVVVLKRGTPGKGSSRWFVSAYPTVHKYLHARCPNFRSLALEHPDLGLRYSVEVRRTDLRWQKEGRLVAGRSFWGSFDDAPPIHIPPAVIDLSLLVIPDA